MNLLTNGGTELEFTPASIKQDITINYNLLQKSDKKVISIDRGIQTDRYACEMTFVRRDSDIDVMYHALQLLRENNKQCVLSDFAEDYFGDHVDHTSIINTVVYSIGELESVNKNTKKFKVVFLATDVSYVGSVTLPPLTCLESGWIGYNEWNTIVNETYNRSNYFVDREEDIYVFKGNYILNKEDTRDLYRYWSANIIDGGVRGTEFTIDDGDFGISNMFGPNTNDITHDVVFDSIKYTSISPTLRNVTITLIKNGGIAPVPVYKATIIKTDYSTVYVPETEINNHVLTSSEVDVVVTATDIRLVVIGANVTELAGSTFNGATNMTTAPVFNGPITIFNNADFLMGSYNLTLGSLTLPASTEQIGANVFSRWFGFNDTLLSIPASTTIIQGGAFYQWIAFDGTIVFNNSSIQLNDGAFEDMWVLEEIEFTQDVLPTSIHADTFTRSTTPGRLNATVPISNFTWEEWNDALKHINDLTHINNIDVVRSNYFEAGTVAHPFAGTTGTPVTSDPNWTLIPWGSNAMKFYGEYARLPDITSTTSYTRMNDVGGYIESAYFDIEIGEENLYAFTNTYLFGDIAFNNSLYLDCTDTSFEFKTKINGDAPVTQVIGAITSVPKFVTISITINGADIEYVIDSTGRSSDVHHFEGTMVDAYNPLVEYHATFSAYQVTHQINEVRLTGTGFPYSA